MSSEDVSFTPKLLTALGIYPAHYSEPADNAAVLARNRNDRPDVQRIARAETIASPDFQEWLAVQSSRVPMYSWV